MAPPSARSLAHPETLGVEQRIRLKACGPPPADDLNLETAPARSLGRRELRRDIAQRDRLLDVVAVPARRHPADDLVVVPDRLVADDVRWRVRVRLHDHR